jgi:hypothetical protein
MMNRKLAQGRHVEWLRASARSNETHLGERTDLQPNHSGKPVRRLLQDMVEGRNSRDASLWLPPRA